MNRGLLGRAHQSSQPGVFSNVGIGHAVSLAPRWSRIRSASTRQSARVGEPALAALLAEEPRVGEIGHPGLALGRAGRAPRLEAGLAHGDGRLAHLLGAAAAMLDDPLEEVAGLLLPVDAGKRLAQRRDHRLLDAVAAGRGEALDHHRLEALDHHAAAHLRGARDAELGARDPGGEAELVQRRQTVLGVGAAQQQRHLEAMRRHRGHHGAFDVAGAAARDLLGRRDLGARRRRVEIEEEAAGGQRRARMPRLPPTVWLAVTAETVSAAPRTALGVRLGQRHAVNDAVRRASSTAAAWFGASRSNAVTSWPCARRSSARIRPTSP